MTPIEMKEVYSPEEIADFLGVSIITVRNWCKKGKLRARKKMSTDRARRD